MVHHMAIIDVYDRQIVGHHESLRCRAGEWLAVWDKALLNRFPDGPRGSGLVLQVDNGCQPSSSSFRRHIALCGARLRSTGNVQKVVQKHLREDRRHLSGFTSLLRGF